MPIVKCIALYPFQGDVTSNKLSFQKGDLVTYDSSDAWQHNQNKGWVYGTLLKTGQKGWCPEPYLQVVTDGVPPAPSCRPPPVPISAEEFGPITNLRYDLQSAGAKSWRALSTGAQLLGEATKQAVVETKYHVEDITKDMMNKQKEVSERPRSQRTEVEQRAVDVGNGAARGSVVGAVYGGIFGGPQAVVRGAARGAVTGGAWGAVSSWKPFG